MDLQEKIERYMNEAEGNLSDKEIFVIGLILGFKPGYRMEQLQRHSNMLKDKYKLKGENEFEKVKQQLSKKGVLNKKGAKTSKTKEAWEKVMGNQLPSQLHQWAFK